MNDQMIQDIETELQKDVSSHHISMSNIIKALEKNDLISMSQHYRLLMDTEAQELVSKLRHRADMMRQRAHEFDAIADGIEKFSDDLGNKVETFVTTHTQTTEVLHAVAHINPSKVTNGET